MSLILDIKDRLLDARKHNDVVAKELLSTLLGEASLISEEDFKAGNTTPTDEKVMATIRKFLKNAIEMKRIQDSEFERVIGHSPYDGKTYLMGEGHREFMEKFVPKMQATDREISILNEYLPKQMTEDELRSVISDFKAGNIGANVGAIMSFLKTKYAGLYDGKIASQLAKE